MAIIFWPRNMFIELGVISPKINHFKPFTESSLMGGWVVQPSVVTSGGWVGKQVLCPMGG